MLKSPEMKSIRSILFQSKQKIELVTNQELEELITDLEKVDQILSQLNLSLVLTSLKQEENQVSIKDYFQQILKIKDALKYPSSRVRNLAQMINSEYLERII